MVGNHRTIYNESLIYLSLNLNPFSKKSEPILQNEPIRIFVSFYTITHRKELRIVSNPEFFQLYPFLAERMIYLRYDILYGFA